MITYIIATYAQELRQIVFGYSVSAPKHEWLRTGLISRDSNQELGYGLKSSHNGTRGLRNAARINTLNQTVSLYKNAFP
jgi:hypothetical protein